MTLAIFDLDETLLLGDSDLEWWRFLASNNLVDVADFVDKRKYFKELYNKGDLDIYEYLSYTMHPFKKYPQQQLLNLRDRFLKEIVPNMILPKAKTLLTQHRNQGDYLLIISATNYFVTEHIATMLQVDDLIATNVEVIDGKYTGEIIGIPSFQDGKVKRLKLWLQQHPNYNMDGSCFYSDSKNDIPLLEFVENPVVVDPNPEFREIATKRHWPIISLR